eukprot:1307310-Rhodomonas_salina.1
MQKPEIRSATFPLHSCSASYSRRTQTALPICCRSGNRFSDGKKTTIVVLNGGCLHLVLESPARDVAALRNQILATTSFPTNFPAQQQAAAHVTEEELRVRVASRRARSQEARVESLRLEGPWDRDRHRLEQRHRDTETQRRTETQTRTQTHETLTDTDTDSDLRAVVAPRAPAPAQRVGGGGKACCERELAGVREETAREE